MKQKTDPKIIIALDYADEKSAFFMVKQLSPELCRIKIGKELFVSSGPQLVEKITNMGFDVFLDLKFHDIPNTVAGACRAAAKLGVWMVNVHASGGLKMMLAAKDAIDNTTASNKPLLIAVTILTSLDNTALAEIGYNKEVHAQVLHLANLTKQAGLDGVVCSPHEAQAIKQQCGNDFSLVTPGVRPKGSQVNDQSRIMTPQQALDAGSNYLVIGRPITASENPLQTLEQITKEIRNH
ncbi:MAG: orotidine-5'-phosphate decarboxylase [Pseudomonadota bacterium]